MPAFLIQLRAQQPFGPGPTVKGTWALTKGPFPMSISPAREADQDPFLLDAEQLQALGEPRLVSAALTLCREQRVTDLDTDGQRLWARVEDAETQEQLDLALAYDADGNLQTQCQCGGAIDRPCVHALASLFAYSQRAGTTEDLRGALEGAIEERILRGRTEVRVEPLSGGDRGGQWLGTWRARSINPTGHLPASYLVQIRSLSRRANHCTCPDFASNQLGTCKHVEAVLHRLRKRKGFKKVRDQIPERAFVYLDWECEGAPVVRLQRGALTDAHLAPRLREHFDASGAFRGRLPEALLGLAETLAGRPDIEIGEDALGYARRLAEDAARAARAREIGERIRGSGGRLPDIRATLYPYQVEGVAFLAGRGRALLADDMGLGKTLQAMAAAYWLHRHEQVERVLVVCPASLKAQWAREIAKFTGANAQVVQGSAAARAVQYRQGPGFYVINYELVLRDLLPINEILQPDLLILDEAQRIKNWRTKVASAVKRIPAPYAFVLTGTPLENRLEDLYSLMQVVDHRVLGPLWRYLVDFHITDERGKVLGYRNLAELRRRLAPVMLRRDRSLVRDQLPERIEQRLDVALTPRQQDIHDDAVYQAARFAQIMKRRPLTPVEQNRMMAALQQARMACDAAGLVDKETEGSPKLDELETLLDELCRLSGLKAVVFSQWERMTEMVEQRVRRLGLGCVRLHGGVPSANRGALVDRFREDDAVQVFISTDAGGVGLNLQCASVLVNLDIPWNPAVLDQRIARIHRLGQSQRVQVILLVAAESYEERVLGLVQGKRVLFDNVVDPEASEDVVGVSRRLAEVLAEDLAGTEGPGEATATPGEGLGLRETEGTIPEEVEGPAEEATESPADQTPSETGAGAERPEAEVLPAEEVRRCVIALQESFGPRIERILASRGGLLVVMDHTDEAADRLAQGISDRVPIALIDRRTLAGLRRLGAASPVAEGETLFESAGAPSVPDRHPLAGQAQSKLEGARLLLAQTQAGAPLGGPATDLLLGALLCAAALLAGRDQPPEPREAGIWLYAEALPRGSIDPSDAALMMRAIALAQGGDSVPPALIQDLAADATTFIRRVIDQA
jgi:superfamily II DNA or RNA helicase